MLTKGYLMLVVKKTDYKTKIKEIENKILSVTGLVLLLLSIKSTEIETKIPLLLIWLQKLL